MERYKITNFDGSIIFERGDDLERLLSATSAHSLFYPLIYNFEDEPIWYVVWELNEDNDYEPIDSFFTETSRPNKMLTDILRSPFTHITKPKKIHGWGGE